MTGSRFPLAVAHGEGRAVFGSAADSAALGSRVSLRYVDNRGGIADSYPANPNGSAEGVAAVCNEDGRVTILMPHPGACIPRLPELLASRGLGRRRAGHAAVPQRESLA